MSFQQQYFSNPPIDDNTYGDRVNKLPHRIDMNKYTVNCCDEQVIMKAWLMLLVYMLHSAETHHDTSDLS